MAVERGGGVEPRERDILELVAQGLTNAQVARMLWISPGTVRKHLENAYESTKRHKVRRPEAEDYGPNPDGRRRFGTISSAITEVLRRAELELRVRDIRVEVERSLGGPVSRHSIKGHLHRGSSGSNPTFDCVGHGRYRLAHRRPVDLS